MAKHALTFNFWQTLRKLARGDIDVPYLSANIQDTDIQKWLAFGKSIMKMHGGIISPANHFDYVDRTQAVKSLCTTNPRHIPKAELTYHNMSFLDIALRRASEILRSNQPVCVKWSGGSDSTLALLALIDQASSLDQIEILLTWESIRESGSLFDQTILPLKLPIRFDTTRCNAELAYTGDRGDELYIDGNVGDQLFGTPKINLSFDLESPWYDFKYQNFLEVVAPSVALSPRPIQNQRDLLWWLFFNFSYNSVANANKIMRPKSVAERSISFYDSDEFQIWAASTDTYYDLTGYRKPMMTAIKFLSKHEVYSKTKIKTISDTWHIAREWQATDNEFKNFYNLEI